jgi:hypothetical protein
MTDPYFRDLEDFSRLHIKIAGIHQALSEGSLRLGLKWRNIAPFGSPTIRLFNAVESDGGQQYLKNSSIANQQISGSFRSAIIDLMGRAKVEPTAGVADFIFQPSMWANMANGADCKYLLFEGDWQGAGNLTLVLLRADGTKIADGPGVWMELKPIEAFYMRGHATPKRANFPLPYAVNAAAPPAPYRIGVFGGLEIPPANIGFADGFDEGETAWTFEPAQDEEKKCVVYVHGISMAIPELKSYTASCYKRLWWEGYKGRLAVFRWATPTTDVDGSDIFNDGEFRSWSDGAGLKAYVGAIRQQMGTTTRISILGHSLGNACVGSALRQGMVIDSYVMQGAAVSTSCFHTPPALGQADPLPGFPELVQKDATNRTPYAIDELGYRGFLKDIKNNVQGSLVNYHNHEDFWLAKGKVGPLDVHWVGNQLDYKPEWNKATYHFYPSDPQNRRLRLTGIFPLPARFVQDPHEAMSYVSRSRTRVIGAEPPAGTDNGVPQIPNGSAPVDLNGVYKFGNRMRDHSGLFQRDIQLMYSKADGTSYAPDPSLYRRLMEDLRVQPD